MLSVRRLNKDNTWKINWYGTEFLIDPWLSGSEIDGFKAFNEQWHATPPVKYTEVGHVDLILISQVYHDHCHPETLMQLGDATPIAGVPGAFKKLQKQFKSQLLKPIPTIDKLPLSWGDFTIARIAPSGLLSTFNALVIIRNHEYILLAPHGVQLSNSTLSILKEKNCKLLATTFTLYKLPLMLGGSINPGMDKAMELIRLLEPDFVLNTHDEDKVAKGIANKLAKIRYPQTKELATIPNFVMAHDYSVIKLENG